MPSNQLLAAGFYYTPLTAFFETGISVLDINESRAMECRLCKDTFSRMTFLAGWVTWRSGAKRCYCFFLIFYLHIFIPNPSAHIPFDWALLRDLNERVWVTDDRHFDRWRFPSLCTPFPLLLCMCAFDGRISSWIFDGPILSKSICHRPLERPIAKCAHNRILNWSRSCDVARTAFSLCFSQSRKQRT